MAAFSTYFCMYAFRKPFAVGTFEGEVALPLAGALSLKSLYVIAQVLGYAASKFLGIKVVSEMPAAGAPSRSWGWSGRPRWRSCCSGWCRRRGRRCAWR